MKQKVIEVEYTDDDILYYIDDQYGNEIGFAVCEDGKEVEYYYAGDDASSASGAAASQPSLATKVGHAVGGAVSSVKGAVGGAPVISREQVSGLKDDLNAIYHENAETMKTLRSVAQDMRDFKDFFSGKPLRPRPESTPAQDATAQQVPASTLLPQEDAAALDHAEHKKKKKKKKKNKAEKKEHEQESAPAQPVAAAVPAQPSSETATEVAPASAAEPAPVASTPAAPDANFSAASEPAAQEAPAASSEQETLS